MYEAADANVHSTANETLYSVAKADDPVPVGNNEPLYSVGSSVDLRLGDPNYAVGSTAMNSLTLTAATGETTAGEAVYDVGGSTGAIDDSTVVLADGLDPVYDLTSATDETAGEGIYAIGDGSGMTEYEGDYALSTQTSNFAVTLRRPDAEAQPVYDTGNAVSGTELDGGQRRTSATNGTLQRPSESAAAVLYDLVGSDNYESEAAEDDIALPGSIPLPTPRRSSMV